MVSDRCDVHYSSNVAAAVTDVDANTRRGLGGGAIKRRHPGYLFWILLTSAYFAR
jgi:hypothetical protein